MAKKFVPGKWLRRLLGSFGICSVLGLSLWVLVHHTSWAGPLVANSLRATIGTDNVAKLEDFVYAIDDRINRFTMHGDRPKAHWKVPVKPKSQSAVVSQGIVWLPFEPKSVGPVHKSWSAPGDGEWVAIDDSRRPGSNVALYKTLVHPDENRSWAELFVVAVDLEQVDLHAAAGTREPIAEAPVPKDFHRPGKVPDEQLEQLLAAFNGGFMTEHGHYGMLVDGITLVKPRENSCTVVGYTDGTVEIATWKNVARAAERMTFFRQTPACMYENNVMHLGLRSAENRNWGATVDGDTVIRRSAIGLDEARRVLYVGISNHTTARALAMGMHHAGAIDVAQLDVNWSYPKFLVYGSGNERGMAATAVMEGFEYTAGDYVTKSSLRDFFYLTRRKTPRNPPKTETTATTTTTPSVSATPSVSTTPSVSATPSVTATPHNATVPSNTATPTPNVTSVTSKPTTSATPPTSHTP
jgi:hypothetical protein